MSSLLQDLKQLSTDFNNKFQAFVCPSLPIEQPAPTPPVLPDEQYDVFGIREIYEDVMPPSVKTGRKYKRSTHNGKPRDTFYFENVNFMDMEQTAYLKTDFIASDEESFKFWGGHHSGSGDNETTRAGRCYSIGLSSDGKPHIAKEYPYHPKGNYNLSSKAIFFDSDIGKNKTIGNLDNRIIGRKCVAFLKKATDGKVYPHFEYYVDLDTVDISKPSNKWKPFFKCVDKGDWVGAPYLTLQGQEHGDENMWYSRTDQVGKTTLDYGISVRRIDPTLVLMKVAGQW